MYRSDPILDSRGHHAAVVSASDAKSVGQMLEAAEKGQTVAITRYGKVRAVVVPVEQYRALTATEPSLNALEREFDAMLVSMQSGTGRAAVDAVFAATPRALGLAARSAARPRTSRRRSA